MRSITRSEQHKSSESRVRHPKSALDMTVDYDEVDADDEVIDRKGDRGKLVS